MARRHVCTRRLRPAVFAPRPPRRGSGVESHQRARAEEAQKKPARGHEARRQSATCLMENEGAPRLSSPAYLGHIARAPVCPLWQHAALRPVLVCISARTWGIVGSNINARPPLRRRAARKGSAELLGTRR